METRIEDSVWDWSADSLDALRTFLSASGLLDRIVDIERIGDGHSNLTYLVSDGRRQVVVRRPPPPPRAPGAHDVLREVRFLRAVAGAVPVAKVLAVAGEGDVLDVPLYVMDYVPGSVITTATPDQYQTSEARTEIVGALVDSLVAIHGVDWRSAGLSDFARPDFNRRHLARMARLLGDSMPKPLRQVQDWLAENAPDVQNVTVLHNDFRLGNVMVSPGRPVAIGAVLDWELASVGDPAIDLGYLLASYPVAGRPLNPISAMGAAVLEPGYPAREWMVQRYVAATGRDVSGLDWYVAFALWKLGVLYEQGYVRAVRGGGDPYFGDRALVRVFVDEANAVIRG